MENNPDNILALCRELETAMPLAVAALLGSLNMEAFHEMSLTEGVHGPIAINIEDWELPINAICFYLMVNERSETDGTIVLAARPRIKDENGEFRESFGYRFSTVLHYDNIRALTDEQHIRQLVDEVIEQYLAM